MTLKSSLDEQFKQSLPDRLDQVAKLLERSGIKPDDVGRVRQMKVSEWQGLSKDEDGNPVVKNLGGTTIVFDPKWAEGPAWPVVQQAAPVTVRATTAKRPVTKGWKKALLLPDPQIGYRRYEDGVLDPFHDERAMNVALQVARYVRPDVIVNLGDFVDFPEWGKYEQEPAFQMTTQLTLDRAHRFLCEQAANAPEAEIVLLEGNHDRRLRNSIVRNAISAFGLRQANVPEGWPVLSMQHLLRLDELGVRYVEGYPAGEFWINDNLVAIHGFKVRSGGSTAASVIDDERVSVVFGHVHRIELQHKTRRTRSGPKRNFTATPGCLCRVDGAVPSTKSSTDCMGRPVGTWENWQQGLAVVSFEEGDGRFSIDMIPIYDGWCLYRDREFLAC